MDQPGSPGPAVYWFNPSCEDEVTRGRPGHQPARLPRLLAADLDSLPLFLAGTQDVVLVERLPSGGFLDGLRAAGVALPRFCVGPPAALYGTPEQQAAIGDLRPWGWSPESAAFLAPLAAAAPAGALRWHDGLRPLYGKPWSAGLLDTFLLHHAAPWLCDRACVGTPCRTAVQVEAALARVGAQGYATAVVKAAFGQSGRNQVQVSGGCLPTGQARWLEQVLEMHGGVVVEPWLERVADLSFHLDIGPPGTAAVRGWTLFVADGRGHYRASWVRGGEQVLSAAARSLLDGDRLGPLAEAVARHLAEAAAPTGYIGPMGVDALLFRDGDEVRLKPIVEVNPRHTMGRIALALRGRVAPDAAALWTVLSQHQAQQAGFSGVADLVARLAAHHPLHTQLLPGPGLSPTVTAAQQARVVCQGVLPTTDPVGARAFASVLVVCAHAAECARLVDVPLLDSSLPAPARAPKQSARRALAAHGPAHGSACCPYGREICCARPGSIPSDKAGDDAQDLGVERRPLGRLSAACDAARRGRAGLRYG